MPQVDSVFLAHVPNTTEHLPERKILMVQHADEQGSWYLPGGGYPDGYKDMHRSMNQWLKRQTSLGETDIRYLAHWKMKNGTITRLAAPTQEINQVIEPPSTQSQEWIAAVAWKTCAEVIAQHQQDLTPWAQFKMAMYGLEPNIYMTYNERPSGASFADEFRAPDGSVWTHPDFR